MSDRKLDDFLADRTASAMKRIEEKIYKEVREGVCEYFGTDSIRKLKKDQIKQINEAQEARDKGFLKLGYNLVLKQLRCLCVRNQTSRPKSVKSAGNRLRGVKSGRRNGIMCFIARNAVGAISI